MISPLSSPELLLKEHNRSAFDCGVPALNEFLKQFAPQNQKRDGSRTYVATRDNRVVGYYTLAYSSIGVEDVTPEIRAGLGRYPIPVLLMARLAVDLSERGTGLGKALLRDAIRKVPEAADIAGLRAMLVHAKDDQARAFYEKFGFTSSPTNPYHLLLKTDDIRASFKA